MKVSVARAASAVDEALSASPSEKCLQQECARADRAPVVDRLRCTELVDLAPDLTDDLLNTIDQPLQVAKDSQAHVYLLCDYNRDGDSYRSPWTNSYDPPISDGVMPPPHLRSLEVTANEVFEAYKTQYYEGGASSVYCWELDDTSFAACVLLKKDVDVKKRGLESGGWDAIHVIEVRPEGAEAHYKLTSTIMLRLATDHSTGSHSSGELKLSGSMTRQKEDRQSFKGKERTAHLPNMGRMIEDMENRMRDSLQDVYFGKTKSTVSKLYKAAGAAQENQKQALASELMGMLQSR